MSGTKQKLPDLRNATIPFLVDETKRVRDALSLLKAEEAYYAEALKARMKEDTTAEGEKWVASLTLGWQERINADLCRQILDAETLQKVTLSSRTKMLTFRPKADST